MTLTFLKDKRKWVDKAFEVFEVFGSIYFAVSKETVTKNAFIFCGPWK